MKEINEKIQSANKAAYSDFETQRRRHQKSDTGVSVAPKKDTCPANIKKKTSKEIFRFSFRFLLGVNGSLGSE